MKKLVKLAAASGSTIGVEGNAKLEFVRGGGTSTTIGIGKRDRWRRKQSGVRLDGITEHAATGQNESHESKERRVCLAVDCATEHDAIEVHGRLAAQRTSTSLVSLFSGGRREEGPGRLQDPNESRNRKAKDGR